MNNLNFSSFLDLLRLALFARLLGILVFRHTENQPISGTTFRLTFADFRDSTDSSVCRDDRHEVTEFSNWAIFDASTKFAWALLERFPSLNGVNPAETWR